AGLKARTHRSTTMTNPLPSTSPFEPTAPHRTVSVVIPTYNMAVCVTRAIASCQVQTHPVTEIIVVDGCSPDDTETVIRSLMRDDPRIRYCRPQANGGHLASLRFGAARAVSEWVALLDADDALTPTSIGDRVAAADRYEQTTGVKPQLVY